jgi:hypothetical protein
MSVGRASESLLGQQKQISRIGGEHKLGQTAPFGEHKLSQTAPFGAEAGRKSSPGRPKKIAGSVARSTSAPLRRSEKALSPMMLAEARAEELKQALYKSWAEKKRK